MSCLYKYITLLLILTDSVEPAGVNGKVGYISELEFHGTVVVGVSIGRQVGELAGQDGHVALLRGYLVILERNEIKFHRWVVLGQELFILPHR